MGGSPPAGLRARWSALPGNTRGAVFMLCGAVSATCLFVVAKTLAARIEPAQIVFFRGLVEIAIALPLLLRAGGQGLRTTRLGLQSANGVLGAIAMTASYFALANMDLADVTVIFYARPLFLIVLAGFFLGELWRWDRTAATLVGFAGVLVVARPGGGFDTTALAAVAAALISAVMMVLSKRLSTTDGPVLQMLYFNLAISAVVAVPTAVWWTTPTAPEWGLLLLAGVFGTGNSLFYVAALKAGEATAISPFDYTRLLLAALLGFVVFDEVPGLWFWPGALLIVGANLFLARREARAARVRRAA